MLKIARYQQLFFVWFGSVKNLSLSEFSHFSLYTTLFQHSSSSNLFYMYKHTRKMWKKVYFLSNKREKFPANERRAKMNGSGWKKKVKLSSMNNVIAINSSFASMRQHLLDSQWPFFFMILSQFFAVFVEWSWNSHMNGQVRLDGERNNRHKTLHHHYLFIVMILNPSLPYFTAV